METNTQPLSPEVAKNLLAVINRAQFAGTELETGTQLKAIVQSYIPVVVTTNAVEETPADQ